MLEVKAQTTKDKIKTIKGKVQEDAHKLKTARKDLKVVKATKDWPAETAIDNLVEKVNDYQAEKAIEAFD